MKRKITLTIIIFLIGLISLIIFPKEEIQVTQEKNNTSSFISMMVEQDVDSSNYVENTNIKFPLEGYHFNSEKSGCENGGILSWNSEKQKVEASLLTSDKCYAYFDKNPFNVDYDFTGTYETFVVPVDGEYKFELWGAQGSEDSRYYGNSFGGKGAYVKGNIKLKKNEKLYVYVGEYLEFTSTTCADGKNYAIFNAIRASSCSGGGGATDIRLNEGEWDNFEGLKSRIMVAAGGGGGLYSGTGGYGGALTGGDGEGIGNYSDFSPYAGKGASQEKYSFGVSLSSTCVSGNGYYSGQEGYGGNAGGGSSFISGYPGCNAIAENSTEDAIIHTGEPIHYSGKVFTNYEMIAGNAMMPSPYGGTEEGHTGNGYAKITLVK